MTEAERKAGTNATGLWLWLAIYARLPEVDEAGLAFRTDPI